MQLGGPRRWGPSRCSKGGAEGGHVGGGEVDENLAVAVGASGESNVGLGRREGSTVTALGVAVTVASNRDGEVDVAPPSCGEEGQPLDPSQRGVVLLCRT